MWWEKFRTLREIPSQHTSKPNPLSREQGQGLVEFAVLLPVLLLLVLGTIDLGIGFKTYIALTNAAREGARWITIHPTDQAGAIDRIGEEAERVGLMNGILDNDGYEVSFSPNKDHYVAGDKVRVSVDYDFPLLFGAVTGLPEIQFSTGSTMAVLYNE